MAAGETYLFYFEVIEWGIENMQTTKQPQRYAEYLSFLERSLTPGRLQHSLGGMQWMGVLSDIDSLAPETALVTGMLHDAAKDLDERQQQQIVVEAGIELQYPCDQDYVLYLHGPVGAYFVRRELGVTDPAILDAITMHTYYSYEASFHAPLVWCLRFADILEPWRDWSRVSWLREAAPRLRQAAYAGQMREAALIQLDTLISWFEQDGKPIHPNMRRAQKELTANSLELTA